ncbi:NAD-binding lipoprotein [Streptomyces sp. TX20-6-3]|uniref:CASTOR/POLLUX-related putative ion channel n=1 Tax=Streptomyces sp. TX20-6-3 TaxID=3028705 RepID=UPI0029BEE945|nr:NAD-binding lipoprotein [Streptomyces sp. TX20-6-3]MDX2561319.1 NAD-binding lipoprotein [Streptomyces sp. TX20-6-3]
MTTVAGWLALVCLAVVAPASALLVWTDSRSPDTVQGKVETVWRTVGQTLRLGGEVGPPLRIVLSVLLALVSLLYVSTLVGLVTTAMTDRLTELQRGQSTVVERGHSLVLGWSEQTPTLVAELLAAHAHRRNSAVVVLADRDKLDMERELRAVLTAVGGGRRVRLLCRRGRPADPAALARVSPAAAGAVVVLPPDTPEADTQVVKTLLALRAVVGDARPVRVVAAVRQTQHVATARLAAGPGAVVLDVDGLAARTLVQCVIEPGLSRVLEDLLDFAGAELHVHRVPGLGGRTFEDLRADCVDACVVGLVRPDGSPLLNPPPQTVLGPGDAVVVLAEDETPPTWTTPPATPFPPPSAAADAVAATDATAAPAAKTATPATPAKTAKTAKATTAADTRPAPRRVLVLGWNRRGPEIVDGLARNGWEAVREKTLPAPDPAHHVLVLGGPDGHPDPDEHTLVTLLRLRAAERESGRRSPTVAELTDAQHRPLAPAGPHTDLVVGGRLVGLLMAQISQTMELAAAFDELFSPAGNAVRLRPATDYVPAGTEAPFATLVEAAGRQGATALGYRPGDSRIPLLNPPKTGTRRWSYEDTLIVVTTSGTLRPQDGPARPAGTTVFP